jgi:hypothetical protein
MPSRTAQLDACSQALDALIDQWADDMEMTTAEAVGVLTIKANELIFNAIGQEED